jgi:hypothetical protein
MANRRWITICLILFTISAGVRLLVWQNNKLAMAAVQYVVTEGYVRDAGLLLNGDFATFIRGVDPPSDANIIMHPPGYPIFLAVVQGMFGAASLPVVQILINSLAPVLLFLIAASIFGTTAGWAAGILGALSPQFAYHSGIILPDELSVLPILFAVFAFVLAYKKTDIRWAVLAGLGIGLSCWLRANALLLPAFVGAAWLALLPKGVRLRFACVMFGTFVLTISPITIRNYLVFDSFVPLSLGTGTTFVEGLGDLDLSGQRGMPHTDDDVMALDAARAGRPDYYSTLYSPDGVLREHARVAFGLDAVGSDPLWFMGGVVERGINYIRLERVPAMDPAYDESDTTDRWLRNLNVPLKAFQRLFITAVFLPLILLGAILLLLKRESRGTFLLLSAIPLYYMSVQPVLHTEYRYVLPAAHILMVFAAVAVSYLVKLVYERLNLNGAARS